MPKTMEMPGPTVRLIGAGHFKERKGYSVWRTQGTSDWLLFYTLSGRGRVGYAGGEVIAAPGDLVLLAPGTPHDYGVEPKLNRWHFLWSHFHARPHWLPWMQWPDPAPGIGVLRLNDPAMRDRISKRFFDVYHYANGPERQREEFAANALEQLLLWCDTVNPNTEPSPLDPRVRETMDFVCRRFDQKLSVDDLAERTGLSTSRFAHLFRAQAGVTPQQFLERQRLERARRLLEATARPIKEVARAVGFDNPFYFTLRFKKHAGVGPSEYRKSLRSK